MTPTVSVIIPTYNRRAWLQKALLSVLSQTYDDFEIVVIDDGSTDETSDLFENAPPKVRYFYQENQGVASARNLGIHHSRGTWLAFLDSDDCWLPQKLKVQMKFHRNHEDFKISQTEEIWIRNGVEVNPMKKHKKPSGWIFEPSLSLCLVSPSSVLVSREVFNQVGFFDETFPVCEDYELWLRVSLFFPIGLVEKALVLKHGGHSDQLSQRFWGMDRFRIKALEKILTSYPLSPQQRQACLEKLDEKCKIYAQGCSRRNRLAEALSFLELPQRYKEHCEILPARESLH